MKLAIIGSRTFTDFDYLKSKVNKIIESYNIDRIISGGANGADTLAEIYANKYNICTTIFSANWEKYGKKAGYIRNKEIVNRSDMGIAFWDGQSKGTRHTIKLFKSSKKEIIIINYLQKEIEWK